MILLWYIIIPAVAAPLAWLAARRSPQAARWIAVAGTAMPPPLNSNSVGILQEASDAGNSSRTVKT